MTTVDVDAARLAVETLFAGPGERAESAQTSADSVLVRAGGRSYSVTPFLPPGAPLPEDVALFDVRPLPVPPLGGGPHGAAWLREPAGTRALDLGDRDGLRAFVRRVHGDLSTQALATILARYALPGVHHKLIERPEELDGLIEPGLARAFGVRPPEQAAVGGGGREIRFATYFLRAEPPDGIYHVGLDNWRATVDADGGLDWSVQALARLLPSPLYSGELG